MFYSAGKIERLDVGTKPFYFVKLVLFNSKILAFSGKNYFIFHKPKRSY
tara:strand:+ start:8157 stop:8303 length:147 start_codon:yes stop_codon:yes gene_type:complete